MIEALLRASLTHRGLVLGAAVLMLAFGAWRATRMPVDVFPDLTAPRVTVVTEVSGMAPEEVERLVTFPIESAVNGLGGLRRVRSASAPGISIVWAEFDWDTTPEQARQRVIERVQTVSSTLPPEASAPLLAPPSSVMGEIAFVALTSRTLDPMELRRVAEVDVRRRLLGVEGISQVVAIGGLERQYQVIVDPVLLERFELTIEDVVDALRRGNRNAPGGYVVEQGQETVVRVLGRAHSVEDLSRVVVAMRGERAVRVTDVATVRVGPGVARGTGSYDGRPAVVLSIVKQPSADTIATTERMDALLDELEPELREGGVRVHRDLFRQSDFIDVSIENLTHVLRDGSILVIAVLFVFLWSLRPTVISAIALPLSLVAALLALDLLGMTLDTMTLGGLAIAIGELVDDAIVDVENVARRLRDRAALPEAERPPALTTVLDASLEIRSSIVSATAILMLVFAPLFFLEGLEGRLLRPLATSYLVSIAASLVVAVTVTPVLCLWLLPKGAERWAGKEPPVLRLLGRAYEPIVRFSIAHPIPIVAGAILLLAVSVAGFFGLGRSFLPEFNEGSLTIEAVTLPGTSLEQSNALGRMAEEALLADPAVASTSRRTGRAERDEHVQGVEASELEVRLREDPRDREELLADIRGRLAAVPGMRFTIGQPISHRIDHMISGQRTALTVKVVGSDLDALRRTAESVRAAIEDVPGLVDLSVEQVVNIPQLSVRIDALAASHYGFSTGSAAEAIGIALWGAEAGRIVEERASTDVVVRLPDEVREDMEALERMRIPTPTGVLVPLGAIAEVRRDAGPNYVMRENVRRRVVVTANVAERDLASVIADIRARVDERVDLPDDVHVEYAGQFEREEAAGQRLLWLGLLVVIGIGVIVATTLRSVRRALIVLANLPLALAGGVVGAYLGGGVLSIATLIGFITLFGIATRNGILLATRVADLEANGVARAEAVHRAARERLAPILMTAVTAGLGLLPLAIAMGEPGSEIQAPMALVILCGLSTSTLLNMIVVPALLARWGGAGAAPA